VGNAACRKNDKYIRNLVGNSEGTIQFGNLAIDIIIIKYILKKKDKGVDWINLAHNRYQYRDLSNTVLNYRIT
jgi:hypothetical protein